MLQSKLLKLLAKKEKKQSIILILLMIIGMFFEMLGIALIIPVISLMTKVDSYHKYPIISHLFWLMGEPSQAQVLIFTMLLLVGIFTIKIAYIVWMQWQQNTYIYSLQAALSSRLFRLYLSQSWTFHLQRNSAQLILNITQEVSVLISNALQPMMILLTEGFVLLGIAALLFYVEPVGGVLVACVLGSAAFAFQHFFRKRILQWGELRQHHEALNMQHLHQGLGGIKDIKLLGKESFFFDAFETSNQAKAQVGRKQKSLTDTPRLWLEWLSVCGLAVLVITMILQGSAMTNLVPVLGIFAAAAFRIIPSLNRCLVAVQSLRYGLPVINRLDTEFRLQQANWLTTEKGQQLLMHSITLENIYYQYPGADNNALQNISLIIPCGKTIGFIGTSGAGKSTLVDLILGLLEPTQGIVKVDDINLHRHLRSWQNQIGYVPQSIYLTDDTIASNIAFGVSLDNIDESALRRALQAAQLESFVDSLPDGLNTIVGERGVRLSGGQRQRIGIARALYHNPSVLVLDEATSALDYQTEKGVMEAIHALQGQKTILIIAHRLSTVAHCDMLYRFHNGQIVDSGSFEVVVGSVAQES